MTTLKVDQCTVHPHPQMLGGMRRRRIASGSQGIPEQAICGLTLDLSAQGFELTAQALHVLEGLLELRQRGVDSSLADFQRTARLKTGGCSSSSGFL